MSALFKFTEAVFKNWLLYMTAGPFLADEVFKRVFPRWRDKVGKSFPVKTRRRIEVALIIIGVFYAGFAAFKEEHTARENAENALRSATPAPLQLQLTETDPQARKQLRETREELKNTQSELAAANNEIETLRKSQADRTITPGNRQKVIELL